MLLFNMIANVMFAPVDRILDPHTMLLIVYAGTFIQCQIQVLPVSHSITNEMGVLIAPLSIVYFTFTPPPPDSQVSSIIFIHLE